MSCVLALVLISAAAEAHTLDLKERDPAALLVVTQQGSDQRTRSAEVLRAASAVLAEHTPLDARSPEQLGADPAELEQCKGATRLQCWVRAVRPDRGEVTREVPRGPRASPRFLFVVALHPDAGREHVSSMMIDLDQALSADRSAARTGPRWALELEDRIFESAIQGPAGAVSAQDPSSLENYFREVLGGAFRPVLEAAGAWDPYGTIVIDGATAGAALELDGRPIGVLGGGRTELRSVLPGLRGLSVISPGRGTQKEHLVRSVDVRPGVASAISLEAAGAAEAAAVQRPVLPRLVFWSGVGLGTAGGVLAVASLVHHGTERPAVACWEASCPTPGPAFASLSCLGSGLGTCRGGVLAAPLGFGLLAAGAAWGVGALLEDDAETPWLPVLLGLAGGAGVYALMALAGGASQ
jgi:hypothetical protein